MYGKGPKKYISRFVDRNILFKATDNSPLAGNDSPPKAYPHVLLVPEGSTNETLQKVHSLLRTSHMTSGNT